MSRVKLDTTTADLDTVATLLDKSRGKTVKISRTVLFHLMTDHMTMYSALTDRGVSVIDAKETDDDCASS